MKLFEDMQDMGGSIQDVVQKMVTDMFEKEIDDDEIEEIVGRLSLSDILALDNAYSRGDKEAVKELLGSDIQLEYSMGVGRQPTSTASTRPAPGRRDTTAVAKKPAAPSQTSSNYSGGVQNGVSTQNIDTGIDSNNPEKMVQDEEPVEEAVDDQSPPRFDSLEDILSWEVDPNSKDDSPVYTALIKTQQGLRIELFWSPEDPDMIGWAEIQGENRKGEYIYGGSGNDGVDYFEEMINDLVEEQIDELSKKTLSSYIKGASSDSRKQFAIHSVDGPNSAKAKQKLKKRSIGVRRAVNRFTKEERIAENSFEIGEVYHVEFENGERSYFIPKKLQKNGRYLGLQFDQGAAGRSNKKPTRGSYDDQGFTKTSVNEIPPHVKKYLQIDELSKKTLGSYADVEETASIGRESLKRKAFDELEKLAQEYQGTMAGMGHRDENDILDDMEHIAKPYGFDLEDFLNVDDDMPMEDETEQTIQDEGYTVMPEIDRDRYGERAGLEGPFQARNGKIVYYDPREGAYYDPDSDMYITNDEYQQMDTPSPNPGISKQDETNVVEMVAWLQRRAGLK